LSSSPEQPLLAARQRPARLSRAALALRVGHAAISVAFLAAIGYVWLCGLTRRRGPLLRGAVAALALEGVAVSANRGDCPLGCLQDRVGDPVPLFELVLSRRAAKLAVPVLGGVTAAGIALVALRPPKHGSHRLLKRTVEACTTRLSSR
jgi:hypothetical protein